MSVAIGKLDRRTALLGGIGVAVILLLRFGVYGDRDVAEVVQPVESIPMVEQRLDKLRHVAALVPAKEAELKQAEADLAAREKGLIVADTAAQAQAQLQQLLRDVGQKNGIQVRGAEEWKVGPMGADYGEVSVGVTFGCRMEQLVNMLADLTSEPRLVATNDIRINSGNPKEKTVSVRLVISGVVPRKLVPEKKGNAF
jgi:hypothetical protein